MIKLSFLFKKAKSTPDKPVSPQPEKVGSYLNFQSAETFKLLRTNLMFSFAAEKSCKVIGFTSAISGEGKTLTVINTAFSFAQAGSRVLVIECDLRLPTVSKKLKLNQSNGLTNMLIGKERTFQNTVKTVTDPKTKASFDVICAGDIPPNPSELLGSVKMREVMEICTQHYDYILLDTPPVTEVTDALIISKISDGMVMVVRQDYSDQKSLAEAMRQLEFAKAKMLGFVFNGRSEEENGYYKGYKSYKSYKGKGYYIHYKYGYGGYKKLYYKKEEDSQTQATV